MNTLPAKILCVDDEGLILESLHAVLRRRYTVAVAANGKEGLAVLEHEGPFAVVLSDMRMPGMDGASFLAQVRLKAPDTVRLLLTGHAEVAAAIAAVNEGQIFRFLTKPCPTAQLLTAIQCSVEQHNLIVAEKVLLEQTLRGSVHALMEVLSLSNPQAFGHALRIRQHVKDMAERMEIHEVWPLEVAALLSQVGYVTLAIETVDKLYGGQRLDPVEREMVARLPSIADKLLEGIPRLEMVRGIIRAQSRPRSKNSGLQGGDALGLGAEMLRIAIDFDRLETSGCSQAMALSTMKGREGAYDPTLLSAFSSLRNAKAEMCEVRELKTSAIKVGMVLAEDVRMRNGALLAARGYEVNVGFVERLRSFGPDAVLEPVRVLLCTREGSTLGPPSS